LRSLPDALELGALIDPLSERWGFEVAASEYAPLGGGSYHWIVTDPAGNRRFITVDDLERKPWPGDRVFEALRDAFDTAIALHGEGLAFVLAPIPTEDGASVIRVSTRYTLAVFPFVEGRAGDFGAYSDSERAALVPMLEALHGSKLEAAPLDLGLPGRSELEHALGAAGNPWDAGPHAEAARELLVRHARGIAELLSLYDRLSPGPEGWVVTHGEPHGGNLISTAEGHFLIDWDTVAFAPPERDLWMLADAGEELHADRNAIDFFRLRWDLADLASFVALLRSPHRDTADTRWALQGLNVVLGRER
jgi:spectinomycin phosphotransferase